ncbi:MAG: decaprenyl-phosphate phosphoribosyltransferase [Acidimicrobiales bacterium]
MAPRDLALQPADDASVPPEPAAARPRGSVLSGLLRIARPRQWIKNVLVFVAPGAAGVLSHGHYFLTALAGFGIFCLAASGTYFVNDTLDAEADRHHPVKRRRPVAAGIVSPPLALSVGSILMAVSLVLAWALAGGRMVAVIAVYLSVSSLYSIRLKHMPVLDLAGLSSGFILRAIAGGIATGVVLTDWFLIVVCFGSLLVATGKRSGEQYHLAGTAHQRPVLEHYPPTFLRGVRLLSASVTITAYCLWAFERSATVGHHAHHPIWFELSIVPVVLTVLQLELHYDKGGGGAPEELALQDRTLQLLGLVWVVLFAIGVYA